MGIIRIIATVPLSPFDLDILCPFSSFATHRTPSN